MKSNHTTSRENVQDIIAQHNIDINETMERVSRLEQMIETPAPAVVPQETIDSITQTVSTQLKNSLAGVGEAIKKATEVSVSQVLTKHSIRIETTCTHEWSEPQEKKMDELMSRADRLMNLVRETKISPWKRWLREGMAVVSARQRRPGTIGLSHRHYNCRHFSHMKNRTIILSLILLLPFVPSMAQEHDDERVLICYETPKPRFNGDDSNNFKNWVDKHKCYPEEARKAGIEGRVTTCFTITKEGKLTKVRILRGIHPLLDQEAVRVIESAPQLWKPGKNHKGETEEMSLVFPVIFRLSDEERARAVPAEYMPLNYGPKERNASFDDGATKSFIIWISNNLNYPEDARKSGLEGRVYVKFKINELGKMVDAAVDCSTDKIFEDEALRVVKSAQDKWKPGRDATGKPVALGYIVPVIFFLPSKASENR